MRKSVLIVLGGVVVLVLLAFGAVALGLHQMNDPASGASEKFTAGFVEKCVAASQPGDQATQGTKDDIAELCRCGADDMREDLADGGVSGLAHMLLVEGFDAKMQRVMDACQTTPSAP
jgi:hypothetical protein